ncbi:hypothetical protein Pcinc_006775 [Petrolisthes cinctipes]|uniref:Uncharacterized protein n=1 Tax=Petrolisthes cinctipes TaxID=88211 RepID=A0AAE1GCH2_PETCI|nr:hypothetical protein Pcinc_006775 [Petrolisthes cinctipes]
MELNWSRCVICQQDTSEPLKCPLHSRDPSDKTGVYASFLNNVEQFSVIDAVPVELLFGNNETVEKFVSHSAAWHKSCYLKFSSSKLAKAKKRTHKHDTEERRPRKRKSLEVTKCFLCEKGEEESVLHEVSTFHTDKNIRDMITELNDTQLLTRICGGDLMAMEAKYHLSCMVKLGNRHRSLIRKQSQVPDDIDSKMNESRAFVKLTRYIEEAVTSGTHLFKLSEIHSLHVTRLEELNINKQVNKTRLKARLLEKFPEAQEQSYGKNSVLVFKEGMKKIVHDAVKTRNFS